MNSPITKNELFALISNGLAEAEEAIGQHPSEITSMYQKGKNAFLAGQAQAQETDWSQAAGLPLSDLSVMNQYLFAYAFISAWHASQGDKMRQNQATSPACLLVSGLGFSPEDVLTHFMKYERVWQTAMSFSGSVI